MSSRSPLVRFAACALVLLLLAGCGQAAGGASSGTPSAASGAMATQYGQRSIPTPALTPPPGWSAILSGLQFINTSAQGGLVVSAAQPGRVVGCAMRTPISQPATPPTFVLSNDAGKTWQTRAIPNLPPAQGCTVLADTLQPDTFAVEPTVYAGPLYVTRNAGVTWNTLEIPVFVRPIGLAGGQLFAVANRSYGTPGSLQQTLLTVGAWHTVAPALPLAGADPYAAAVDPDNPAIMYLSGFSGTIPAVYRTTDGGVSWQLALTLPAARHIALYTAHQHQAYAEQLDGFDSQHQLFSSANGGATWQGIAMQHTGGGDFLWVSPRGRALTETSVDSSTATVSTLDPTHGTFTPMGAYTLGSGPILAAVVDGPMPALLYATPDHIWRLPLSA